MSCLNLRIPPARKAWKSFTSKLQNKLHKLNKSKAIKKPKNRFNPPPTKAIVRDHNRKNLLRSSSSAFPFKRRRNHLFLQKKSAPVYVDKLFRDPVADVLAVDFPPTAKAMKIVDKQVFTVAESAASKEERKGDEGAPVPAAADDMWESLGFASPLMRGIDERAEQFIASFRAEMEVQEIMASDLYVENASL
ncbi:uncharacterized protein LOC8289763 [Ricinus communis]|uniref:uncharacterized protein LOC8289763 n=1 Tax=Ricinus communis TaxID=3988 RepID=UPI00201A4BAF|nr:uncharacterized protein LOC8289763 [Ricinus communis]